MELKYERPVSVNERYRMILLYMNLKKKISFGGCVTCFKSLQSCLTLCDSVDCSPPGSSVHRILQARILEWVGTSRGSSWPGDRTSISYIFCTGRHVLLPLVLPGKPQESYAAPATCEIPWSLCRARNMRGQCLQMWKQVPVCAQVNPCPCSSSQPRDRTQVSRIAGGFFTIWAIREAHEYWSR